LKSEASRVSAAKIGDKALAKVTLISSIPRRLLVFIKSLFNRFLL